MALYTSPKDIRPLVKITHPDPIGTGADLALLTSDGTIVKRYTTEEARDQYLTRNQYTLTG